MTAEQWVRVLKAGANGIDVHKLWDNTALPTNLYGTASLKYALIAMATEAELIAEETRLWPVHGSMSPPEPGGCAARTAHSAACSTTSVTLTRRSRSATA